MAIIDATVAAAASAAANCKALLPYPSDTTRRIPPLKWMHLCFVCGVATDAEVPAIWEEVVDAPTKQEGLAVLLQDLLNGI